MIDSLRDYTRLHVASRVPGEAILVTAAVGQGKTTALARLAASLRGEGYRVGGILAPRVMVAGVTLGYDVLDVATPRRAILARLWPPGQRIGRYYLRPAGLALADQAIRQAAHEAQVVLVDEVGPAELGGGGHHAAVVAALAGSALPVLVVRSGLVPAVQATFGIGQAWVWSVPAESVPR